MSGFRLVGQEDVAGQAAPQESAFTKANATMLLLSLRALSQRTVTAVSAFFTAALVASVWLLVSRVLPDPTPLQLIGCGGYAAFVLMVDIVRRRG